MGYFHRMLAVLALSLPAAAADGGSIVLPSDVSVTLTAARTIDLTTGQPVDFTLNVTNHGPAPVHILELTSSNWVDQFHIVPGSASCYIGVTVVDLIDSFYYFYFWDVAGLPGTPDLGAGETKTCHFQLALTVHARATTSFSFGLPDFIVDPDPSNDRATVTLQRAVATVPALSAAMLVLLAGLLALTATMVSRRWDSVSGRPA
jgi:hypothetical protein